MAIINKTNKPQRGHHELCEQPGLLLCGNWLSGDFENHEWTLAEKPPAHRLKVCVLHFQALEQEGQGCPEPSPTRVSSDPWPQKHKQTSLRQNRCLWLVSPSTGLGRVGEGPELALGQIEEREALGAWLWAVLSLREVGGGGAQGLGWALGCHSGGGGLGGQGGRRFVWTARGNTVF